MMIAIGIGLHNFAEGLAIGSSAARGALQLAVLLVIGFGLHNATEGFGIVAPMAAQGRRPSWRYLLLLGLIGGGPTTARGQRHPVHRVPHPGRRVHPLRRYRAAGRRAQRRQLREHAARRDTRSQASSLGSCSYTE